MPDLRSPSQHHCPLTGTGLSCLVIVCEQLAEVCYVRAEQLEVDPMTFDSCRNHGTARPHETDVAVH